MSEKSSNFAHKFVQKVKNVHQIAVIGLPAERKEFVNQSVTGFGGAACGAASGRASH